MSACRGGGGGATLINPSAKLEEAAVEMPQSQPLREALAEGAEGAPRRERSERPQTRSLIRRRRRRRCHPRCGHRYPMI